MKVIVRTITGPALLPRSPSEIEIFREHGCSFDADGNVRLNHADPHLVEKIAKLNNLPPYGKEIVYTEDEISKAKYFRVGADDKFGAVQPERVWVKYNYDQSRFCQKCYSNAFQVAPFRLKMTPKSQKLIAFELRDIWRLTVSTDVWEQVFRDYGVDRYPLVSGANLTEIPSMSQLVVHDTLNIEVTRHDILATCATCGTDRYNMRPLFGFFRPLADNFHIALSKQYVGGGVWMTYNAMIVSKEIHDRLRKLKVKGLAFQPCRQWP